MSTSDDLLAVLPADEPAPPRGHPVLAWLVILLMVGVVLALHYLVPFAQEEAKGPTVGVWMMEMQARVWVGLSDLSGDPAKALEQAALLNHGPPEQRLRYVVLAGELGGPEKALKALEDFQASTGPKLTEAQKQICDILKRLYDNYDEKEWDAPEVDDTEKERLRTDLGWFGKLALAPEEGNDQAGRDAVLRPARQSLIVLFVVGFGGLLLGLAGTFGLFIFVVLLLQGVIKGRMTTGTTPGGIYAETFALWLVVFFGLSVVVPLLRMPDARLLLSCVSAFLSLVVLAWPVLRGIPWSQVRRDIGLHAGRGPVVETAAGFACYAMTLPLLVIGVIFMFLLLVVQNLLLGGQGDASSDGVPMHHPIVEFLAGSDWRVRLQVFLLAAVQAPLVEEIMFRGVLHRHLRESTRKVGKFLSFLLSATVVSFLFAVIHPQGFVAIPPLMALAFGFSIAREWRDTVLPGMVGHALHNGGLVLLLLLVAG
jgi:membrane protease YdiL (CAAX protease family)